MCATVISRMLVNSTETAPVPQVLFEDRWLLIVSKPSGLPVQSDTTGDPDLLSLLRAQRSEPDIELVHRIDRPVSGVVLLARTKDLLPQLHALFSERAVEKHYWAIVEGVVEQQGAVVLEHALRHDAHAHRARVSAATDEATVRTNVQVLAKGDRYTLVDVVPEGGAFHQIRAQLAAWGHAIKGDVKYGARRGEKDRSIALHARSLRFVHPATGKEVMVMAPPPVSPLWQALLADVELS